MLISHQQFLDWLQSRGIGIDPAYPDSEEISFVESLNVSKSSRFWCFPECTHRWMNFVATLMACCEPWERLCIWPQHGNWREIDTSQILGRQMAVMRNNVGVPSGFKGGLIVDREELAIAETILFTCLSFGWRAYLDVYLIPDHGRHIIRTDHHEVVHVTFGEQQELDEFVERMAQAGFHLPKLLPDETFRPVDWITPEDK